jgi:hypothetical protein
MLSQVNEKVRIESHAFYFVLAVSGHEAETAIPSSHPMHALNRPKGLAENQVHLNLYLLVISTQHSLGSITHASCPRQKQLTVPSTPSRASLNAGKQANHQRSYESFAHAAPTWPLQQLHTSLGI